MKKLIPQRIKNYYHLAQAVLANFIYGFPSRKITIIGVTGTNGKTTTCQMIAKILEESGAKVALASTINFKIADKEWVNKTKFTTLSSFSVQKFIQKAVEVGCQYLVLETSSHALDQNRVWGVEYDTAVMTNVTREHLDYHKTMDDYRLAKYKLFTLASNIVVNLDMEMPKDYLVYRAKNKYGYTLREENFCDKYDCGRITLVKADSLKMGLGESSYKINNTEYKLHLPGDFNIENALAATCVGMIYGIKEDIITQALEKIPGVPGRMEHVPNNKNLEIIIDYALTPDSLEKLYKLIESIRSNPQKLASNSRVIAVFGSCGDRDRGKRPIMGEIVSRYADCIVVTNEDPYGEDPVQIINEVFSGIVGKSVTGEFPNIQYPISNIQKISNVQKLEGKNCWRILDRREAIRLALNLAKPGDIIIVTGKGAEETMMTGGKMIPWNDKKVILEELNKL